MRMKVNKLFFKVTFNAASSYFAAISFGFVIGYTSPAIPSLKDDSSIPNLNENNISLFSSIMTIGGLLGCLIAGYVSERYGRKVSIIICNVSFIIGWYTIYDSHSVSALILGRFICGLSSGMCIVVCPVYLTEISPLKYRGIFLSSFQLFVTIGILLVYSFGLNASWRDLCIYSMVPSCIGFLMSFLIAESPDFYLKAGKEKNALNSLIALYGNEQANIELKLLQQSMKENSNLSFRQILTDKKYLVGLKIAIALNIFQQFIGINAIMFYSKDIMNSGNNVSKQSSGYSSVMIALIQVIATLISVPLVEKFGRRTLLMTASIFMALGCIILSASLSFDSLKQSGSTSLFSLMLYIIGFSFGWGPIPQLICNEILPSTIRSRTSSFGLVVNWGCAFLVTYLFLIGRPSIGIAAEFFIFAVMCVLSGIYVYYIPETRKKNLEQIQNDFVNI